MDPRKRLIEARTAADAGYHDVALAGYIWFHDHALEHEPSLYGVRLSFALSDWKELAEKYPPALIALTRVRNNKVDALERGDQSRALFHDIASINECLGDEASTYGLFQKLDRVNPEFARKCASLAIEAIVAAADFSLAARYHPDPESALLDFSEQLNRDVTDHRAGPPVKAPRLDAYTHIYCQRVRNTICILKGLSKRRDAEIAREWAVALVEDRRIRSRVRDVLYSSTDA